MRPEGWNVDEGQAVGCKHGKASGGTKRRKAQYERAQARKRITLSMKRAKRGVT